jgi:hypothetical protein
MGLYSQKVIRAGEVAKTSFEIIILQRLRAGDSNDALELIEEDLDGQIVNLALGGVTLRTTKDMRAKQVLERASGYRKQFPHRPRAAWEEPLIKDALSEQ